MQTQRFYGSKGESVNMKVADSYVDSRMKCRLAGIYLQFNVALGSLQIVFGASLVVTALEFRHLAPENCGIVRRFDRTPTCDRRTDGWMERRRSMYHTSIASRVKSSSVSENLSCYVLWHVAIRYTAFIVTFEIRLVFTLPERITFEWWHCYKLWTLCTRLLVGCSLLCFQRNLDYVAPLALFVVQIYNFCRLSVVFIKVSRTSLSGECLSRVVHSITISHSVMMTFVGLKI